MTDRAQAVYQLLRAYLAWVPGPQTATGNMVRRSAKPGETPSKRVPCPACRGTKTRRQRGIEQACDECLHPQTGKPTGRVTIDDYTRRQTREGQREPRLWSSSDRTAWEIQTEAILRRLDASLRLRTGEEAEHDTFTGAVDARDRMYRHGSFAELDNALSWLRDASPTAHSLVWSALIYAPTTSPKKDTPVPEPQGQVRRTLEAACEVLAARMPAEIRVPPWLVHSQVNHGLAKESRWRGRTDSHTNQREHRDEEIREARANGIPVPSLMSRFALSQAQVYRAIAGPVATVAA